MKKSIKGNKILFCIIIALAFVIVLRIIGNLFRGVRATVFIDCVAEGITAIFAYILLVWSGKKYILNKKLNGFWKGLAIGGVLVVITGGSILAFFANEDNIKNITSNKNLIFFIIETILIGITEEFIFRGAIQNTLYDYFGKDTRKGVYKSVLLTGTFFGFIHLSNILAGVKVSGAIVQALSAFSIGCFFAAVYYRCDNIWSVVVLHAILDFNGLKESALLGQNQTVDIISNYSTETPATVIFVVLFYLALTAFILRKSKVQLPEEKIEN